MYEPILMSKRSWKRLSETQQDALLAASKKAEAYFLEKAKKLDERLIDKFKKAGVEVVAMSPEDYQAWLSIAQDTSYKKFAEKVPNGKALIEKALAVE